MRFYIQNLKYREIDVVYAGLTVELPVFATYMRALADGDRAAIPLWVIGLCKADLNVYKPPQSRIQASPGRV
ncbi:hypothetical protein CO666_14965 [Rhizobium chutanense]|uniref:Uncharacterized protein n=1 Tax=Rhizobium chutanense TaxID=2035448 RepID=A0A2A6JBQ7_9HYPH|nr:hypothetical protein CO666_14965 [Rhizobium chutanense]